MVTRFLKTAVVLVLLLGAFCAFHREVLFGGKVYQNQWILRDHAPFREPEPSELNPLNQSSDLVTHYFPYKYLIMRALGAGHAALWNPYSFCGFPLYANGSAAVFSPSNLFLLFWPPYEAYRVVFALYFIAGAALLFAYLRRIGLSRVAAANGCLALVLSPTLVEFIDFDTLHVFVWSFPLALIAAERLAERRKGAVPLAAAALFATALAGHIHVLINTVALFTVYSAVKRASAPKIGASLVLFGFLSTFLLYPMWNFMQSSQWIATSFAKTPGFGELWRAPITPFSSIFPVIPKLPHFYEVLTRAGRGLRFSAAFGVGALPFVFGLVAVLLIFAKGIDRRVRFWAAAILLYHYSTVIPPLFFVPGVAGGFINQSFDRLWQIYIVGSAVLVAWGTDAVVLDARVRAVLGRLLAALMVLVVLPVAALAAVVTFFGAAVEARLFSFMARSGLAEAGSRQAERFPELFREARALVSIQSPLIWVPAAALIGLAALLLVRNKAWVRLGVAALLLADLWVIGTALLPKGVEPSHVAPQTSVTDFLKKEPGIFRIMALQGPGRVLKPNLGVPYGLYDVGGQDSVLNGTYLHFGQRYLADRQEGALTVKGILDFEQANLNAASWLNVKYLVASDDRPAPAGLDRVFEGEGAVVYRNPDALPRVFFTRKAQRYAGVEEAFRAMAALKPGVEPVIRVDAPGLSEKAPAVSGPVPSAEIRSFAEEDVAVSLETTQPGWVVYTDNFDPGWKAYDNGERAEIHKVNGLFKGVQVGPGRHSVRFVYRPDAFYRLAVLSALALVLTAWLLLRSLI